MNMQVHVNKGFLGRRHSSDGLDSGFSPISPGDYLANFNPEAGLVIVNHRGDAAYLKLALFEEKIAKGELVVIEI
jgi:arginine decarboxylase-like protein